MANEAELKIKPRVVDARDSVRPIAREVQRFDRTQQRAMSGAQRNVSRLRNMFRSTGNEVRRTGAGLERLQAGLEVIERATQYIRAGGRTFYDWFLGPNAELENAQTTFRVMIGDAAKADALINRVRTRSAKTPFRFSELLEGSRRMLRLTGSNIEQNEQLLELAEKLAAINPTKTIVDASEALLDAQVGEFERLKEFGIKLRKEEVSQAKKAGKLAGGTFGDEFLDATLAAVQRQTGGRDPVVAMSKNTTGRISTLRDIGEQIGQAIGKPTWEAVGEGVEDLVDHLNRLRGDPQFQKDIQALGETFADVARWSGEMVEKLPAAIAKTRELVKTAKEFWADNSGMIKGLGAAYIGNRATGGAITRGLGNAATSLMFGRGGGGGAGSAVASALGGRGQPVYVTNLHELGGGMGSFASRASSRAGAASAIGKPSTFALGKGGFAGAFGAGGATGIGGGTLAAGGLAAGLALATLNVYAFGRIIQRTRKASEGLADALERERAQRGRPSQAALTRKDRAGMREQREQLRSLGIRGSMDRNQVGQVASILKTINLTRGQKGLDEASRQLSNQGVAFGRDKRGRVTVQGGYEAQPAGLRNEIDRLADYAKRVAEFSPARMQQEIASGTFDRKDQRAMELTKFLEASERNAETIRQALRGARRYQIIQPGAINVNNYVRNAPVGYKETLTELQALD